MGKIKKTNVTTGRPAIPLGSPKEVRINIGTFNKPSGDNNGTLVNRARKDFKKESSAPHLIVTPSRPSSQSDWLYDLYCQGLENREAEYSYVESPEDIESYGDTHNE